MFAKVSMIVPLAVGLTVMQPAAASTTALDTPSVAEATGPELAAIDYRLLYRRMSQLGMLSQELGYTLTIGADGTARDCDFSQRFKSAFVRKRLCEAFIDTTGFKPARDAEGNPVSGTYQGKVAIASFFQPDR